MSKTEQELRDLLLVEIDRDPILMEQVFIKIRDYIDSNTFQNRIYCEDITEKLTPYLSDKAKEILKYKLTFPDSEYGCGNDKEGELHICYIGITVSKTAVNYERGIVRYSDDEPTKEHYKEFALLLNKAVGEGLIEQGVLSNPLSLKLAVLSPSNRWCLLLNAGTRKKNSDLIALNTIFNFEGQLPRNLDSIISG